jgi:putative porin
VRVHRAAAVVWIAAGILCGSAAARAEDPQPSPTPPPSPPPAATTTSVLASLPIRMYANVNLRQDYQRPQDKADTLLDPNRIDGLLTRLRFGMEFKDAQATVSGGLRVSAGETPNPTAPFMRLGDAFRPVTFGLDQFYVDVRPLKDKARLYFTLGKMPLPFWRGDKGTARAEMTWDDDISPVGGAVNLSFYKNDDSSVTFDTTGGYFIVEWFRQDRFAGLVGDTWLVADQVKLKVHRVTIAGSYYDWEHLNSGARAPSFVPGSSAVLYPGTNAFLLRPGPQHTNAEITLGPGAFGFASDRFRIVDLLGQVSVPVGLPWLGRSELFVLGQFAHNFSVPQEKDGWGGTVGLTGGDLKRKFHPYTLWFTYRKVDADAALGTFADSDLGGGTDVKGFEISADYRVTKNLAPYVSYFNMDVAPLRSTTFNRLFFGVVWDF